MFHKLIYKNHDQLEASFLSTIAKERENILPFTSMNKATFFHYTFHTNRLHQSELMTYSIWTLLLQNEWGENSPKNSRPRNIRWKKIPIELSSRIVTYNNTQPVWKLFIQFLSITKNNNQHFSLGLPYSFVLDIITIMFLNYFLEQCHSNTRINSNHVLNFNTHEIRIELWVIIC